MKIPSSYPCGLKCGVFIGAVVIFAWVFFLPIQAADAPALTPIESPASSSNPDLTKPIPLLTMTNADVHKFVIGKTQAYASVGKIETDSKNEKYVILATWDFKMDSGVYSPRQKINGLNPTDKKFVLDWATAHGLDGRAASSPAPLPGAQAIAQIGGENAIRSYLVNLYGVLKGKTIVAIASGGSHDLALCADGMLVAWGKNEFGQLGDGHDGFDALSVEPVVVDMAPFKGRKVIAIAATGNASLAICEDGSLFTWGSFLWNERQPGSTTIIPHGRPALFAEGALKGRKIVAISAQRDHCVALCADGRLVEWGIGSLGHEMIFKAPVLVDNQGALQGKKCSKLVTDGAEGGLVLCSDGTLAFWGHASPGVLPAARKAAAPPPPVLSGSPYERNTLLNATAIPIVLADETGALQGKTVTDIASKNGVLFALCSDGTLLAWENRFPTPVNSTRNGNSNTKHTAASKETHPNPIVISGKGVLKNKTIQAIACSPGGLLLLCSDNTLVNVADVNLQSVAMLDPFHILSGRTVQAMTANGLVLFQQPGGESTASSTSVQP